MLSLNKDVLAQAKQMNKNARARSQNIIEDVKA